MREAEECAATCEGRDLTEKQRYERELAQKDLELQALVVAHGGELGVRSELGQGSTF